MIAEIEGVGKGLCYNAGMCFSPTASLVAGGALSAGGVMTLRRVRRPSRIPFAAIPLLFGVQQLIEGVVWLSFGRPLLHAVSTVAYVFFSHALWPAFLPFAVWMIEPERKRKKIIAYFALFGLGLATVMSAYIIQGPVTSAIVGHSIAYDVPLPAVPLGLVLYALATCGSCLVSSRKFIRMFAVALFLSLFIAYWAYGETFTSVWCFFAAILSLIIYVHFRQEESR